MGILLVSSVLFPNLSPELSFVDSGIQYGDFGKKYAKKIAYVYYYLTLLNIEKNLEPSWDIVHGWIE